MAAQQEKVLVFTQFREITEPLAASSPTVFGRPGLVLHGGTPVKQRAELVERFQEDDGRPFFVLSVKAGGTGLNLTAASHVIHFDRWWNPAVENQATDRAYRIGQKQERAGAQVRLPRHRRGAYRRADRGQAGAGERRPGDGGGETLLTEMSDDELMAMVALDLRRATAEA